MDNYLNCYENCSYPILIEKTMESFEKKIILFLLIKIRLKL